jgi:putative Mg2+ transporter-C (MgtC) family protein
MIVSAYGFAGVLGPHVILDPSRIAAQVITGVGFLGAGSIILRNEVVKGLTTAASLWAVAAIGLAVGGGLYMAGAAATALILFILAGIKPIEERYRRRRAMTHLRLQADQGVMSVGLLEQALGWRAAQVKQLVVRNSEEPGKEDITVTLGQLSPKDVGELIQILAKRPEFSNVSETAA